eukprot:503818-Amphidinium_carterae.1
MGVAPTLLGTFRHSIFRSAFHISTRSQPYLAVAARAFPQLDPARALISSHCAPVAPCTPGIPLLDGLGMWLFGPARCGRSLDSSTPAGG